MNSLIFRKSVNEPKVMKTIFTLIALCFFCLSGVTGPEAVNPKKTRKLKATAIGISEEKSNGDSSNYTTDINGLQNLVTITTDSLNVQTDKTLPVKANASNNIVINGQGNTVAINQENKNNKVVISQSGNNNLVKISQSSRKP